MGIFKGLSDRKQHRAYVKEGEKRDSSRDFGGAIESYTKALEMKIYKDKPDYMVHYKRGCTYEKMGEIEKAVDDFKIFLSADDRQLKASSFAGAVDSFTIGWQRTTAQICLTNYTFEKLLRTYDFDVGYSNERFYDWGHKFKKVRGTLKESPQETTYRMGVAHLLQEKHKEAIQHLDEAIEMNPEDARSYLFRGIAHAFESRKGGLFGPSRSAKELSKSRAISDFDRAIALSKDNALIEQADKWKKNVTGK
jgi:tetratricopeptide (TPR) repeat protein